MKKYGVLTWILIKRQCKNKAFIGMLVLVCLFMVMAPVISDLNKDDTINVALYSEDTEIAAVVMNELVQDKCDYNFYICDSYEVLLQDVQKMKATAGYVFTDGFSEGIKSKAYKGLVKVIENEEDIVVNMISETVFAAVFSQISCYVTVDYLAGNIAKISGVEDFEELYKDYLAGGSVFSVEFTEPAADEEGGGQFLMQQADKGMFQFSFRNIMALFIMAAGMLGGYEWLIDRQKGTFDAVRYGQKKIICVLYAFIPTAMAGVITFFGLILLGNFGLYGVTKVEIAKEIYAMIFYIVIVSFFSLFFAKLINSPNVFAGFAITLILLSFIACPVIVDLSLYVPLTGVLQKFFVPYYYIRLFL